MFGSRCQILAVAGALALCRLTAMAQALPLSLDAVSAAREGGRSYWDMPLPTPLPADASVLALSLDRTPGLRLSLHLQSGAGWYSAPLEDAATGTERIPVARFTHEGAPGPLSGVKRFRISAWGNPDLLPDVSPLLVFRSLTAAPPASVAILRPTSFSAPGEEAFGASLALRCARLLDKAGIPYDFVDDCDAARATGAYTVRFLPYAPTLPDSLLSFLRRRVAEREKCVVFYNASEPLGSAFGIRPGPWRGDKNGWFFMEAPSLSLSVPARTPNLLPPRLTSRAPKGSSILATWRDARGRTTKLPAVALTPDCAWFAHTPPLATPSAVALVRAILESWGVEGKGTVCGASPTVPPLAPGALPLYAWADAPSSLPSEDSARFAGCFLKVPDGEKAMPLPSASSGLPPLHAWVPCGHPVTPAAQKALLDRLLAVASGERVAGIHLDYIRLPDGVAATPEATASLTEFVREASKALRAAHPDIVLSAAVFPTPEAAAAAGQDWPAWVREGLLDFVCPMIYTETTARFSADLSACLKAVPAETLVPGIGVGADEAQVDATAFAAELASILEGGCRGGALFTLESFP